MTKKINIFLTLALILACKFATATNWVVNQKHNKAHDNNIGTAKLPFKTISKAASIAMPGDTVIVFEGVYRERVAPARGGIKNKYIVYIAASGNDVCIKGSEIWKTKWIAVSETSSIYKSKFDTSVFAGFNPFIEKFKGPEKFYSLGQIFVNSESYAQVQNMEQLYLTPGGFYVSENGEDLYLNYNTKRNYTIYNSLIEYSVRNRIFAPKKRGLNYIEVNGFRMEHCANQFPSDFWDQKGYPQSGALGCRSGNHWIIRNNSIRFARSIGIDCGSEGPVDLEGDSTTIDKSTTGFHLIENNTVSDNGICGICGWNTQGTIVRYNLVERNNKSANPWAEAAGIKFHFMNNGIIEGNIVRDNDAAGIWLDNVWYNARITRNTVIGNSGQGIFVELGYGNCMVDNNVVAYTKMGDGIYTHDASGVTIANNLIFCNSHYGIYSRIVSERTLVNETGQNSIVESSDNKVFNNIFIDNYRGNICFPANFNNRAKNNKSDYNLYANGMEWQWEGLEFNSFTLGSNDDRVVPDSLKKIIEQELNNIKYKAEKRPNLELWKTQPLLTIDLWRIVTGNDKNSFTPEIHKGEVVNGAVMKGAAVLSPLELFMNISNGEVFKKYTCPAIKGIDKDFYGKPIINQYVLPGPFQNYSNGYNHFKLIPTCFQN